MTCSILPSASRGHGELYHQLLSILKSEAFKNGATTLQLGSNPIKYLKQFI
jgi:hypothetical protein